MAKTRKLRTVRPAEVSVGMQVLSSTGAMNLPPQQFTVRRIEDPTPDTYRPGLFLRSIELIDHRGYGGWETVWDRPEACGPVFHLPATS